MCNMCRFIIIKVIVATLGDGPYLDLNVPHFGCRANYGPANQRREDMLWEVGSCIATLDKLRRTKGPKQRE